MQIFPATSTERKERKKQEPANAECLENIHSFVLFSLMSGSRIEVFDKTQIYFRPRRLDFLTVKNWGKGDDDVGRNVKKWKEMERREEEGLEHSTHSGYITDITLFFFFFFSLLPMTVRRRPVRGSRSDRGPTFLIFRWEG